MLEEPRAGRLAAWGNALFAGLVSPDDAVPQVVGPDAVHRVEGLPGELGPVGLTLALGRLRALGAVALRIALPVPGHPLGLSGPPDFNTVALSAGEAVLASGSALGLVPDVTRAGPEGDVLIEVRWRCLPVRPGVVTDVPTLAEAEQELARAMRETAEGLARLDVAGAGAEARAGLTAYREHTERDRRLLAPGYPPRAVRVLELAQRVGALVALAGGAEQGSAVSAGEMAARDALLRPVERASRRARVAAYNTYAEELDGQQS